MALAIESTTGDLLLKNGTGTGQNYGEYFIWGCDVHPGVDYTEIGIPAGYTTSHVDIVKIYKPDPTSVYVDATGFTLDPQYTDAVCGGANLKSGFPNVQKFELKGLEVAGANLCAFAISLTDVILHEGLETVGENAFQSCKVLTKLELPNSLTSVGTGFCYDCDNMQEIYVTNNCMPPTDNNSLSFTDSSVPAYVNGITLRGPGAAAWKAALPDRTTSPYRKLILDPEWS